MSQSTHVRPVVLFGSSGLLGSALCRQLKNATPEIPLSTIYWKDIQSEMRSTSETHFAEWLTERFSLSLNHDFIFANGITDPTAASDQIEFSNYEFPRTVITAFAKSSSYRFLTLGTIQENFPGLCTENPYLRSKLRLGNWMLEHSTDPLWNKRLLHVRIHTLYGKPISRHLFLGQILNSLKSDTEFHMSTGEQLREYHHVDDIALAISAILKKDWILPIAPILELNSGRPVKLSDIAQSVFGHFNKLNLLKMGSIPKSSYENTVQIFERTKSDILPKIREPILGIIEEIESQLKGLRS